MATIPATTCTLVLGVYYWWINRCLCNARVDCSPGNFCDFAVICSPLLLPAYLCWSFCLNDSVVLLFTNIFIVYTKGSRSNDGNKADSGDGKNRSIQQEGCTPGSAQGREDTKSKKSKERSVLALEKAAKQHSQDHRPLAAIRRNKKAFSPPGIAEHKTVSKSNHSYKLQNNERNQTNFKFCVSPDFFFLFVVASLESVHVCRTQPRAWSRPGASAMWRA